jgi:hypothetical protein
MGQPPDVYEAVEIGKLRAGDTVLIDGTLKTICRNDIKRGFCGVTLWGDSHRLGRDKITRVTFGAEIARQRQGLKPA